MKILHIAEEYGYNAWYACVSDERYEEIKQDWQTIKGLNCLVPVRFLIPEARNLPVLPEHNHLTDYSFLIENKVEVISVHIHQSDDSYLGDLSYEIPEQESFEFKGVQYSEDQVTEIFHCYRDEDDKEYDKRSTLHPELFQNGILAPKEWYQLDGFGQVDAIYDWPEDCPLPKGWVRTKSGEIQREQGF